MSREMDARDAITGSLGECYITLEGRRYNFAQVVKVEATMEKTKTEVPILGKTGRGNKSTGWKGTGNCEIHYNTSEIRDLAIRYAKTGQDFYFDLQITNEDPTSTVGRQTVILKDCNADKIILAKIAAEDEYLSEEIEFTFEDVEMPEKFKMLDQMNV